MKRIILVLAAATVLGCSRAPSPEQSAALRSGSQQVQFKAQDGGQVFADLYRAPTASKSMVLMFHQAGSNSVEYAPIAPRVVSLGFDCLAVDLRSGGDMFGALNRTAAGYSNADYEGAYLDMEGALAWAQEQKYGSVIVWGSSYSASLALRLAGEHPGVKAVLAFSPGEYFKGNDVVAGWAAKDKVPTFMAFTPDERSNGGEKLFASLPVSPRNAIVAFSQAVHGASTLRSDRNPLGAGAYWTSAALFLKSLR